MTAKERYLARKAAGMCVFCGRQEADGSVWCKECHERKLKYDLHYRFNVSAEQEAKALARRKKWAKDHPEYFREYNRRKRADERARREANSIPQEV